VSDGVRQRLRAGVMRATGEVVIRAWEAAIELGAIGPDTRRGKRYIHIGSGTMLGPQITLSAGMVPGQRMVSDPVISIGDRCLIGKGSGIVGHLEIVIGDDVWTGHHVYITDQNHGYSDRDRPISQQVMPERPVSIGDGSWLGHGTVVLPGARIGRHVVIGANSVVTGEIPDFSVAVGAPARVIRTDRTSN
jgi:acetyltransferase-like isoleucine patch superfamily enzyme